MVYHSACQRADGKWDYTCESNGSIYPVGYCHEYSDPATWEQAHGFPVNQSEIDRIQGNKDKYHVCGHDTEKEA